MRRDDATGATWHVTMKPSVRRHWTRQPGLGKLLDYVERVKAAVRAKVEHPFHIVKKRFGLKKVPYRGLANLLIAKRRLFELHARGAS